MDSLQSSPANLRRHARNISHSMPRRTPMGTLEEALDDPLAESSSNPSRVDETETNDFIQNQAERTSPPPLPESGPLQASRQPLDARFLKDPGIYHEIPVDDIPHAFLESPNNPPENASLPDLIHGGHFRHAAAKALVQLQETAPNQIEHIMQLLYTRFACLVLISRPDVASQEAIPLIDLLARTSPAAQDIITLIPWELRLLLVRLQSIGSSDGGRRGILSLYGITGEARSHLHRARASADDTSVSLWSTRLKELGLRVCDALVEMGELETATRHLDTLRDADGDEVAYRKALLRIRMGDLYGARNSVHLLHDETRRRGLTALLLVGDGDYAAAVESWQSLIKEFPSHEVFAQNVAVALVYTGKIVNARSVLEDLSSRLPTFPSLLFNISTIYELCSERASQNKAAFIENLAKRTPEPHSGGWERANFEFKL